MGKKNISDMNQFFSVEYKRDELKKKLKRKGETDEKINEIIKECDEAYKKYNMPYPEI